MTSAIGRRIARHRHAAALLAVVALVAGCLDAPVASVQPTPTRPPEPTATTTNYKPDITVWYEGLVLTFGRITAELDALGGPVTVSIHIENPGEDLGELNAPVRLVVGEVAIDPTRESHVPAIPGGGVADVVLAYDIQGVGTIAGAVIRVGEDPLHVGLVPIDANGKAATFKPVEFPLSGTATAGGLRVRLRKGLLRWDLPDWSQELDADLAALTLTYDVTFVGSFPGGGSFTGDNVRLRLPDGKVVGPRRDGRSQSVELIGPGKTKSGLSSRFEIPSGLYGRYALVVRDGSATTSIPFTIKA